ncbi:MAG: hypothetical protein QW474_00840 [Candidatus Aenigmatarchaeota archaeon]
MDDDYNSKFTLYIYVLKAFVYGLDETPESRQLESKLGFKGVVGTAIRLRRIFNTLTPIVNGHPNDEKIVNLRILLSDSKEIGDGLEKILNLYYETHRYETHRYETHRVYKRDPCLEY